MIRIGKTFIGICQLLLGIAGALTLPSAAQAACNGDWACQRTGGSARTTGT